MVMIWNQLANGNSDLCAILVIINSLLQLVLFSPFSVFFLKVISGDNNVRMSYQETSIAVGIYLGIPLAAGMITRFSVPCK
jgi:ACR3 family arsenite transporter